MYRFSKVLSLTFVLFLLTLIVSCGQSSSSSSGTAAASASGSGWKYVKGGKISETPVTISILTHSGHGSTLAIPSNDLPVYQKIQEHTGINIDWQILDNPTYRETSNIRMMSNDLPDIAVLLEQNIIAQMVEDGMFIAYDDLNYAENTPYAQEAFKTQDLAPFEKVYRSLYPDGKMYGFGCTVLPRFLYVNMIMNVRWLANLGLPEPSTVDELISTLTAFRDNDPNQNGRKDEIPFALIEGTIPRGLGHAFGLNFEYMWEKDASGKLISSYTTDKFRDFLEFRKKLYDMDLVDKENRTMNDYYELVAADRLGSLTYYGTFQRIINDYSTFYDAKDPKPVFRELLPLENIYNGRRERFSRLATGLGEPMLILKDANHPEVCLRLADWLWASPEFQMLRDFGIEGMSYEMRDGVITPIQPDDYTGGIPYLTSIGGNQPPFAYPQSEIAWRIINPQWVADRADEIKQFYIDGLQPVVLNAEDMRIELQYSRDVNTFRDEQIANFITGRRPLSEFPQFVQEVNALGLEAITAIYARYHQ